MDRLCAAAPALDAPRHTVGSILRQFLPGLQSSLGLGARSRRLLWRLARCRTGELGANIFRCPHCRKHIGPAARAGIGIVRSAWRPRAGSGSTNSSAVCCP